MVLYPVAEIRHVPFKVHWYSDHVSVFLSQQRAGIVHYLRCQIDYEYGGNVIDND